MRKEQDVIHPHWEYSFSSAAAINYLGTRFLLMGNQYLYSNISRNIVFAHSVLFTRYIIFSKYIYLTVCHILLSTEEEYRVVNGEALRISAYLDS